MRLPAEFVWAKHVVRKSTYNMYKNEKETNYATMHIHSPHHSLLLYEESNISNHPFSTVE